MTWIYVGIIMFPDVFPPDIVKADSVLYCLICVLLKSPNLLFGVDNHKKHNKRFSYAIKDYAARKFLIVTF